MKLKDEAKVIAATKEFIRKNPLKADFSLEAYKAEGIGTDTVDDLVAVMLAGWKGQRVKKSVLKDGTQKYENEFNASYGWLRVLEAWFSSIAPALEDGSELQLDGEKQYELWTVEDGEAV